MFDPLVDLSEVGKVGSGLTVVVDTWITLEKNKWEL